MGLKVRDRGQLLHIVVHIVYARDLRQGGPLSLLRAAPQVVIDGDCAARFHRNDVNGTVGFDVRARGDLSPPDHSLSMIASIASIASP